MTRLPTNAKVKIHGHVAPKRPEGMRLRIVREGEPVPEIAPPRLRKMRTRKPKAHLHASADTVTACPLCETVITRFDANIYSISGHCGPCHEALTEA